MSSADTNSAIRFGVFELDLAARQLRKNGTRIKLQDQPFRVLQLLLERPGEVVTRDELKEKLWSDDTFVEFDHSLNTAIQKIRNALGDSATNPRFVGTIPRHGYRFLASVQSVGAAHESKHGAPTKISIAVAIAAAATLALAAYTAGWIGWPADEPTATVAQPVPLTTYPGREIYPSFSPDGDWVTFTWEGPNRDNWDIYVKRIGEEQSHRLTEDPASDFNSVWSPDGRRIAFLRDLDDGLRTVMTVPAMGGPAREVLRGPGGPGSRGALNVAFRLVSWHPDGRHLVVPLLESPDGPFQLHVVDADTGTTRVLLSAGSILGDVDPSVSPDGSKLAFRRLVANFHWEVHIVELTDSLEVKGKPKQLLPGNRPGFSPTWTPDGREVVFSSQFAESVRLWRVLAAGGEPIAVTQPSPAAFPVFSPAGGRAAFAYISRDYDTWEFQPATGQAKPLISSTFWDVTPQYSPDGARIAFSSSRSGYREIWLCDADGANPVQLSHLESRQSAMPSWSPDGSWIAFQSFVGDHREIFVVRATGGEPQNLTDHPAEDMQPTVSRNSRWIYFSSDRSGGHGIWKIAAEGGEPIQLTSENERYAMESLDGRTLYVSDGSRLWSMPTSGGPRTLEVEQFQTYMDWSVGQDGIYFRGRRDTTRTLEFYDFRSRAVTSLMEFAKPTYAGVSVSPDGKAVLFVQGEPPESDIMLVDDFR